jgi:hypothetical protein
MGPGGIVGQLVPNLGAIVPLMLAPHLVIVVEVGNRGIVGGNVLLSTRVTVNGHGIGLFLIMNRM